jgi:hypothetical protein
MGAAKSGVLPMFLRRGIRADPTFLNPGKNTKREK